MSDMRNPLAKARDEWLESSYARTYCRGPVDGVFLRNRLIAAFIDGWAACERSQPLPSPSERGEGGGGREEGA